VPCATGHLLRRAGDGDAAGGKVESGHHREFGRIGHDLDLEQYFGQRYRTDLKQFEWLGGNECDHLAIGLWAAQFR
jgi:hypothetical protein